MDHGTVTDENGEFSLEEHEHEHTHIYISYVGFKTEKLPVSTIKHWEVQLIEDNTIQGVEISAKGSATRFADEVNKVEVIGTRELQRAACCSLAGCFNTNASVETATTNVITDAKELRMLGLAGVYNQILFDGMPFIQGASYTYGTSSYPGTLIESIFVSKGTNSVLQGAQGISGQINIIPHKVDKAPKWFFNVFANSFGESQYNVNHMLARENWNNLTAVHLTLPAQIRDKDGDGFRDIVRTQRMSIYNKWVYNAGDEVPIKAQIGLRAWGEQREGGQVGFRAEDHEGGTEQYGQTAEIGQFDIYTKLNYKLTEDLSITSLSNAFVHNNESYFGIKRYEANQRTFNSDLFFDYFFSDSDHNLKFGTSIKSNRLEERIELTEEVDFLRFDDVYNTDYDLPGLFAEAKFNLGMLTVLSGVRTDRYGEFGWKMAPRAMARLNFGEDTDLRLTAGKGIRIAHPFSEYINILAGNRELTVFTNLRPEEAWTYGINGLHTWRWSQSSFTLSSDFYHTSFINQIFPHFHHEPRTVQLHNDFGESVSNSFHVEGKLVLNEQFDIKTSYNHLDVYRTVEGVKTNLPFVPKSRWMINGSYSLPNDQWQFDLGYRFTGERRLPPTDDYPEEFQIGDYSDSFRILDFQITYRNNTFEIYGGAENILDFRQEFPLMSYEDPFGPFFDTAFTWGPTRGREFYIGLRYEIR